jgi:Phage Tail Collar Domain
MNRRSFLGWTLATTATAIVAPRVFLREILTEKFRIPDMRGRFIRSEDGKSRHVLEWPGVTMWCLAATPTRLRAELDPPEGVVVPVGTVLAWDKRLPLWPGLLPCDGRKLKRSDYPALFNAIGHVWD